MPDPRFTTAVFFFHLIRIYPSDDGDSSSLDHTPVSQPSGWIGSMKHPIRIHRDHIQFRSASIRRLLSTRLPTQKNAARCPTTGQSQLRVIGPGGRQSGLKHIVVVGHCRSTEPRNKGPSLFKMSGSLMRSCPQCGGSYPRQR